MSGNDEGRTGKNERKEKKESEAKRRQTQGSSAVASATAAPLSGEAHIYRRSTAVLAPRSLSSQGTQPQARLPGTRRGHVLRIPLSGRYPPLPVPVQRRTSRSGRSAGEMMPKTARVRVASPPAGTALARAIRGLPPGPRPTRARFGSVCIRISDECQQCSDVTFSSLPDLIRQSMRRCRALGESAWTAGSSPVVTKGLIEQPSYARSASFGGFESAEARSAQADAKSGSDDPACRCVRAGYI